MIEKRAALCVSAAGAWSLTAVVVLWPWMRAIDRADPVFALLAHLNAGLWWLVLLWALHHLFFQLAGLLRGSQGRDEPDQPGEAVPIAVLYTTCDDFDEEACLSCLRQKDPSFAVYLCDDSRTPEHRERIDRFVTAHRECRLVRRSGHAGYKAGNLNHALRHAVDPAIEWFLLIDADQRLPPGYLRRLRREIPSSDRDVAFVQAAHCAVIETANSEFQRALGPEVELFYQRDLSVRQRYGFVPLLGHGALVRRAAWSELGGFPEVVSEDFAFALRAAAHGRRGVYAPSVESREAYPHDLGAFLTRLRKFSAGSAELVRGELARFFRSGVTWVEKWDFAMVMLWYVLMPCLLLNGFLSAYVVHEFWDARLPYLHPWLPYVYTWLLLVLLGLCRSVTDSWTAAVRFYFWSSAVYTAVLPICSWAFLKHLFQRPRFDRTPKGSERNPVRPVAIAVTAAVGVAALGSALHWRSPFSPILVGQGAAFLSVALLTHLNLDSVLGKLARLVVYLPGTFYLVGLAAVWSWVHGWLS